MIDQRPISDAQLSARPSVAVLLHDTDALERIRSTLRDQAEVRYCASGKELLNLLTSGVELIAVVTELWDKAGAATAPAIQLVKHQCASIQVLVFLRSVVSSNALAVELFASARAGADVLVLCGYDELIVALQKILAASGDRAALAIVIDKLSPLLSEDTEPIIRFCLNRARQPLRVSLIAEALGVHRRTLVYRLSRAGFPSPQLLIGWIRLFLAVRLLQDGHQTVRHVASLFGFSSATALRNAMHRRTGLKPSDARQSGTLDHLLSDFVGEVTRRRLTCSSSSPDGCRSGVRSELVES